MSRYRKRIARITHAHTHTTHKPVQHGHYCFTSVNNIVTVIPLTYTHVQVILLTKVYPWTFFTSRTLIVFISFWHHLFSVRDERLESFLSESHFCWQSTTLVHIFVVQRSYQTQISLSTSVQEQSPEHATPSNRQKYRSQNSSGLDVNNEEKWFQKYSNHHCSFFFYISWTNI